jgi:hypothetical protein
MILYPPTHTTMWFTIPTHPQIRAPTHTHTFTHSVIVRNKQFYANNFIHDLVGVSHIGLCSIRLRKAANAARTADKRARDKAALNQSVLSDNSSDDDGTTPLRNTSQRS